MESGSAIQVRNLSFRYRRQQRPALTNLSFRVEEGDFLIVSGPNGAGKTTLISCLCGVAPRIIEGELRGEVLLFGDALGGKDLLEIGQFVGVVLQDAEAQLFMPTVRANLAQALELRGYERAEVNRRIVEAAQLLNVDDLLERQVTELSGGQRQRVVLAGAVALRPRLLLLDEPTVELDPQGVEEFFTLLGYLNRSIGLTVVLTTHEMEKVCSVANRLIVLDEGSIVAMGEPRQVLAHPEVHHLVRYPQVTELFLRFDEETRSGCALPLTTEEAVEFASKIRSERESAPASTTEWTM
jgi:energy-coupling factor transport system ATP-binding protein